MTTLQRLSTSAQVRAVSNDDRTVDVIASTFSKDSYGTRIDPDGWELEQFRKNPVITWAHDDRGFTASGGRPIARALPETIRVEDGKLKMRLLFPKQGVFAFADEVFGLIRDGFLNAVSVGFDPMEWEDRDEEGSTVRVYKRHKLVEVAVVTVPSNDDALVQRHAKTLNRDESEIRSRIEKVERMAEEEEGDDEEEQVEEVEETTDEPTDEEVRLWRDYFNQKKPMNKAASKVLKKFYEKVMNEEPPSDEIEAWNRMSDAIDAIEEGEEKADDVTETTKTTIEVKEEEEAESPSTPPETPEEPARKASVHIPLDKVVEVQRNLTDVLVAAAVKASRQGIPLSDLDEVIDAAAKQFAVSISNP